MLLKNLEIADYCFQRVCVLSCLQSRSCRDQLFATLWTVVRQAPRSMGILQARILEGVAMPSSGDLSNPGTEPRSPALQADSLPSEPPGKPTSKG